ncbi:hypothetical protein H2204_012916 [Knufia peltigerae]|uniref:DNA (cytosine-5-)-methyltransferase n=1 Tax=Knufia peltigerae TaxID=1002370 RepID=A0AA38XSH5_9EURO|nr:hypothetical protein H2204_012916 [Knufia peltigerae]
MAPPSSSPLQDRASDDEELDTSDNDPYTLKKGQISLEDDLSIDITVHAHLPTRVAPARNQPSQLLGYITFKKKTGLLEMSNFQAKLEREHLDLGESSKRDDENLAGFHGEGFKLAALVMVRNGYGMKFESNSFYWNFVLRGQNGHEILHCSLNPRSLEMLRREKARFATLKGSSSSFRRSLSPNIWEDTTVKVGALKNNRSAISLTDFRKWLTVTLDLQKFGENDILRVRSGDLILAGAYIGAIYLKGLKVEENRSSSAYYRFGYNFHHGKINRDREKMMDRHEEAQMVAAIWQEAMCLNGWSNAVADHYFHLLQDDGNPGDTFSASKTVSRLTMGKLWDYMRITFPDSFFFSSDEDSTTSNAMTQVWNLPVSFERCLPLVQDAIIEKDLGKRPYKLKSVFWKLLKKYSLVRTPHEERVFLFSHSPPVSIPNHTFSIQVDRALRCALKSSVALEHINIQFVKGRSLNIDVLFQSTGSLLRIHDKWLASSEVHQNRQCSLFEAKNGCLSSEDIFLCDHAINDLIEMVAGEVQGPLKLEHGECQALRSTIAKKLQEMPRAVRMKGTGNPDELLVSWAGAQSRAFSDNYGEYIDYSVILHKTSSCEAKKNALISDTRAGHIVDLFSGAAQPADPCGCPRQTIPGNIFHALFRGLDTRETYFPMVSRLNAMAFYASPPAAIQPAQGAVRSSRKAIQPTQATVQPAQGAVQSAPAVVQPAHMTVQSAQVDRHAEDCRSWETWNTEHLPQLYGTFVECREAKNVRPVPIERSKSRANLKQFDATSLNSLECEHLDYTFENNENALVLIEQHDSRRYVLLIHDILRYGIDDNAVYRLVGTKYSFLADIGVFNKMRGSSETIGNKELILHFEDFSLMGTPIDAEMIDVADIALVHASDEAAIKFIAPSPMNEDNSGFFCRYAIQASQDPSGTYLTSLAPHLIRWKGRKFTTTSLSPLVFDLSPNVLGTSEGFAQANFSIRAALGFDNVKDATWKIRHNNSQVFDGIPTDILRDFQTSRLQDITLSQPVPPKVALISSGSEYFRLNRLNEALPTIEEFLKPLTDIRGVAHALEPDFYVMLLSPAVLHRNAVSTFSATILELLEKRMSVHLRLFSLKDLGLPQSRNILVVTAGPFSNALSNIRWRSEDDARLSMADVLRDLSFENPRSIHGGDVGLVRSRIGEPGYIFNHNTGRHPSGDDPSVIEPDSDIALHLGRQSWIHPDRRDRLTVRELARIQGFPDDFVFFGSEDLQYETVCRAVPPIVAKKVAQTIRRVIERYTQVGRVKLGQMPRGNKRAKVNDDQKE